MGGGMAIPQLFASFATVAFFKLVLFSVFEMRYLVIIWKARRPVAFAAGWEAMRRELGQLYSRFYCALLAGIFLAYRCGKAHPHACMLALYSCWLPQIVRNAHTEVRRPFRRRYLLGTAATRLAIPLYFFGYAGNFVGELTGYRTVDLRLCALLVLWTAVQVAVLLAQDTLGPRFLIPRALRPKKYDYRRQLTRPVPSLIDRPVVGGPLADGGTIVALPPVGPDCPICMCDVDLSGNNYLVTPCDHVFHDECLQQWMEVKMECPSCRAPLPPVSDDRLQGE